MYTITGAENMLWELRKFGGSLRHFLVYKTTSCRSNVGKHAVITRKIHKIDFIQTNRLIYEIHFSCWFLCFCYMLIHESVYVQILALDNPFRSECHLLSATATLFFWGTDSFCSVNVFIVLLLNCRKKHCIEKKAR